MKTRMKLIHATESAFYARRSQNALIPDAAYRVAEVAESGQTHYSWFYAVDNISGYWYGSFEELYIEHE